MAVVKYTRTTLTLVSDYGTEPEFLTAWTLLLVSAKFSIATNNWVVFPNYRKT